MRGNSDQWMHLMSDSGYKRKPSIVGAEGRLGPEPLPRR